MSNQRHRLINELLPAPAAAAAAAAAATTAMAANHFQIDDGAASSNNNNHLNGTQLASPAVSSWPQQQQEQQLVGSPSELLLVVVLVSLILISIIGNCLVCVAIFTDRRLRKLCNAFIVSLAIADLFVSCLVMTFALCNDLMNYWLFGDWFCDVWISSDIMCCTASILNLCAISLDRFVHIKDGILYNRWMSRKVAFGAVITIWLISALVSFVPTYLGWHEPDFFKSPSPALATSLSPSSSPPIVQVANLTGSPSASGNSNHHSHNLDDRPQCMLSLTPTYAVVSSTISFFIPCLIMLGLYSKLFACARKHVQSIQAISKAPHPIATTVVQPATFREPRPEPAPATSARWRQVAKWPSSSWRRLKRWLNLGSRTVSQAEAEDDKSNNTDQTLTVPLTAPPTAIAPPNHNNNNNHHYEISDLNTSAAGRAEARLSAMTTATTATRADEEGLSQAFFGNHLRLHWAPSTVSTRSSPESEKLTNQAPAPVKRSASFRLTSSKQQQHQQTTSQLATHKAAITLGIIMGSFLLCWVPFFCLNIIKAFCQDCIPSSMFRFFTWLGYANSALNPIIYGIHNSEFRCAFNRIFFKHLSLKNGRDYLNRRFSYDVRQHSRTATERDQTMDCYRNQSTNYSSIRPPNSRSAHSVMCMCVESNTPN